MSRIIRLAPRLIASLALAMIALASTGPAALHAAQQVPNPICGVWEKTGTCCSTSSGSYVNHWHRHCKMGTLYEYDDWACFSTCGS